MPLVSVLTPTQAHNADHLGSVFDSLVRQQLPAGWEWEWLVQEDGRAPRLRGLLPADERIRYGALGVQAGPSATRNAALARAGGAIVAGMDHDDVYADGGLGALVAALEQAPSAAWSCGRCGWLLPDGGTWEKPDVLPAGLVPVGTIGDVYRATQDWPFPAAFAAYRRPQLVAAGGWPAIARSEDAALLAVFNHHHPGIWVDRVVAWYRRWEKQKTVEPADIAIRAEVQGMIFGWLDALDRACPR